MTNFANDQFGKCFKNSYLTFELIFFEKPATHK